MSEPSKALVLFSGGQDSTTCLAWALDQYDMIDTIGFDYGQRHRVELDCRTAILEKIGDSLSAVKGELGQDTVIDLSVLGEVSETALTSTRAIQMEANGLPSTFVPGRNIIFLSFAAAVAYRSGITDLVGGMCETDYSGYPDCRNDTIQSCSRTLSLGMETEFSIHTPLMHLDKAQTWQLAHTLGGEPFVNLIVQDTHTCYRGDRSELHAWGYGCGECPACELRANGYGAFAKTL